MCQIREVGGKYQIDGDMSPEDVLELAKIVIEKTDKSNKVFGKSSDSANYMQAKLAHLEHEVFQVVFLDNKHQLIASREMFRGTVNGASVYPREVVKEALALNAVALIFGHNHPSGDPEPSRADISMTASLKTALETVDIRILDHIVVGTSGTVSFAARSLL